MIPFRIELESSKLVGKELTLYSISLIFVRKYAVVLPYEANENLKWELIENYSIFNMFFRCYCGYYAFPTI